MLFCIKYLIFPFIFAANKAKHFININQFIFATPGYKMFALLKLNVKKPAKIN